MLRCESRCFDWRPGPAVGMASGLVRLVGEAAVVPRLRMVVFDPGSAQAVAKPLGRQG